jgi:hypothetical protein
MRGAICDTDSKAIAAWNRVAEMRRLTHEVACGVVGARADRSWTDDLIQRARSLVKP